MRLLRWGLGCCSVVSRPAERVFLTGWSFLFFFVVVCFGCCLGRMVAGVGLVW